MTLEGLLIVVVMVIIGVGGIALPFLASKNKRIHTETLHQLLLCRPDPARRQQPRQPLSAGQLPVRYSQTSEPPLYGCRTS